MPGRNSSSGDPHSGHRLTPFHHLGEAGDEELVDDLAAGCEAALAELYERHAGSVFSFTKRVLGDADAAAEVVEEVFLQLWEDPYAFDTRLGGLRSHLLLLARRASLLCLSEERVQALASRELPSSSDVGVVKLALFQGRSCRQMAELLGITEREVKRRLRLGLERLRPV